MRRLQHRSQVGPSCRRQRPYRWPRGVARPPGLRADASRCIQIAGAKVRRRPAANFDLTGMNARTRCDLLASAYSLAGRVRAARTSQRHACAASTTTIQALDSPTLRRATARDFVRFGSSMHSHELRPSAGRTQGALHTPRDDRPDLFTRPRTRVRAVGRRAYFAPTCRRSGLWRIHRDRPVSPRNKGALMASTFDPNQVTFDRVGASRPRQLKTACERRKRILTSKDKAARTAQELLEVSNVPDEASAQSAAASVPRPPVTAVHHRRRAEPRGARTLA